MSGSLMLDGLKAMILGMGMVYVFLVIMIYLMKLMSKALAPFKNALVKASAAPKKKAVKAANSGALSGDDKMLAQAAVAAVKLYRGE